MYPYKEGDLGCLNMEDRLAYVRSLATKFNLKEFTYNSYGVKVYVYYIRQVCNSRILEWCEEQDHVRIATELRINRIEPLQKDGLYAYGFKPEYSIRNIERRLTHYNKQVKEFMVNMKKQDIENDFKST